LICNSCKIRFGIKGINFWSAKKGVCENCKKN